MSGLTVEGYAREKRLPVAFLRQLGVRTVEKGGKPPCVAIPYQDADGRVVFTKYRGSGEPKFWSDPRSSPALYGLHRLAEAESGRAVLLVEGESDAQTAWYHDVLAIGVPGATAWRSEWAPLVAGREGFVWQEPGPAGERFVRKIAGNLEGLRVIRAPEDGKDLSALHLLDPDGFRERLDGLVKDATPAPPPPPPERPRRSANRRRSYRSRHRKGCSCGRCRSRNGRGSGVPKYLVERARRVPLMDVAHRLGIEFGRRPGWARCPFHDDHDPSLHVNERKGRIFCNPCGADWDGIGFWRAVRSVDFPTAIREMTR